MRLFDVSFLRGFISSGQHHYYQWAAPDEIQPVASSIVDSGLAYSFANRFDIAQITFLHAKKSVGNHRHRLAIPEAFEPLGECGTLDDLDHFFQCNLWITYCQP